MQFCVWDENNSAVLVDQLLGLPLYSRGRSEIVGWEHIYAMFFDYRFFFTTSLPGSFCMGWVSPQNNFQIWTQTSIYISSPFSCQLKAGISGAELEDTSACARMWEAAIAHSTADRRWIAWMCSVQHMVCTKFTCAVPCRYCTQIQWLVNLVGIGCSAHYSQASFTLAGGQSHGCMHVTQIYALATLWMTISGWVPQLDSKFMFQIFFFWK
jgi:hypothetical protein